MFDVQMTDARSDTASNQNHAQFSTNELEVERERGRTGQVRKMS